MGRDERRTGKTIDEHIAANPQLSRSVKFFLRRPALGCVAVSIMLPFSMARESARGARAAARNVWQNAYQDFHIFYALARGRDI